jgi:Protein of unknown function (DUF3489)
MMESSMTKKFKPTTAHRKRVTAKQPAALGSVPAVAQPRLTDRQLVVLSAAAQRDDQIVHLPETLTAKARDALAQALLRRALVMEMRAGRSQPEWRRDEEKDFGISFVLTAAGLAAIGVEDEAPDGVARSTADPVDALPPAGSKQARLVAMLSAAGGCTVSAAAEALGWLPHTTRAALTGLRRKGYRIERVNGEGDAGSRHRIVQSAMA